MQNIEKYNLDRYAWEKIIDKWVFDETTRKMLKRKLLDGISFERLAEEFDVSTKTAKNKIYRGMQTVIKHVHEKEQEKQYNKAWKLSPIRKSPEDESVFYVCLPGRRLIFRNGEYSGWYRP